MRNEGMSRRRYEIISDCRRFERVVQSSLVQRTDRTTSLRYLYSSQEIGRMRAKTQLLLVTFCVGVLLVADVSGEHEKRHHHRSHSTTEAVLDIEDVILNKVSIEETDAVYQNEPLQYDPCMHKHCSAGRVCKTDEEGVPQCVCVDECETELDPRRKVCTNLNETWPSDCEVYQARCFCKSGDPRCTDPEYKHVHIEYYGQCREMPECTKDDMSDFPRRMRDWLFNIMRDLADRQELPEYYIKIQRAAETNLTLRWSSAAVWKWCDLDGSPHDRTVSRHELFPIRAPLMALEHCIAPFLDSCDVDDNHKITLAEWGKCLELDVDTLDSKCGELAEIALEQE